MRCAASGVLMGAVSVQSYGVRNGATRQRRHRRRWRSPVRVSDHSEKGDGWLESLGNGLGLDESFGGEVDLPCLLDCSDLGGVIRFADLGG